MSKEKTPKGFIKTKCLEYTDNNIELSKLGIESDEYELVEIYIKVSEISTIEQSHRKNGCSLILVNGEFVTIEMTVGEILEILNSNE